MTIYTLLPQNYENLQISPKLSHTLKTLSMEVAGCHPADANNKPQRVTLLDKMEPQEDKLVDMWFFMT